jgi:cell division protein FtsN
VFGAPPAAAARSPLIKYVVIAAIIVLAAAGILLMLRPAAPPAASSSQASPAPSSAPGTRPDAARGNANTPAPAAATVPAASPSPSPQAAAAASTPAPAAGERFDVIVASFRTDVRATSVAAEVAALGLPIHRRVVEGWQQVVSGPFTSRTAAEDAQQRIHRAGLTGTQIVPAIQSP